MAVHLIIPPDVNAIEVTVTEEVEPGISCPNFNFPLKVWISGVFFFILVLIGVIIILFCQNSKEIQTKPEFMTTVTIPEFMTIVTIPEIKIKSKTTTMETTRTMQTTTIKTTTRYEDEILNPL